LMRDYRQLHAFLTIRCGHFGHRHARRPAMGGYQCLQLS
jgi:hypothetical protein